MNRDTHEMLARLETMIELHISMTGKGYHPKAEWRRFHDERKTFATMADARAYLKAQYGTCKRSPMYVGRADGTTTKCGYVYSFRASDCSHSPKESWIQADWVSFRECKTMDLETEGA